jgi:small subunit ribosomal protein S1
VDQLKRRLPGMAELANFQIEEGKVVRGVIKNITEYGAFVDLGGIDGLLHITDMSWGRINHPSDMLRIDDQVEVMVLHVDKDREKIALGLKQKTASPWENVAERFAVGEIVQGRVRNLTDFGAFVEVEEGVDGLIHLSNMAWTKSAKHPSEFLKKGQKVDAVVLALDPVRRRLSLGLKQLSEDPEQAFFSKTRVGDVVRGKVSRLVPFGAFVQLQEGLEGLCHASEFDDDHSGAASAKLEVGSEYEFRVIRVNPTEKKVGLSMREAAPSVPAADAPKTKEPVHTSTMAEALSSAGITPYEPTPSSSATES